MKKLLKNCRIISPDVDIARGYVIVENDTITAVGISHNTVNKESLIIFDSNGIDLTANYEVVIIPGKLEVI